MEPTWSNNPGMTSAPMEEADFPSTDTLPVLFAEQINAHRADLVSGYLGVLQETLFTNRSDVRPSMLSRIASDEADALVSFLTQQLASSVEHGAQLCQIGLGEQAILRLGQVARQFFLSHLEAEFLAPALDLVDAYQNGIVQGFIKGREKTILIEQERIRSALERAIGRYTVEIKEVQELALRASEANEFKSRFIARISHELRTPLGALLGMAEMLQENVYGPLTPAQADITRRIFNNARALEQVFEELLDQSRIEAGQLHLKEEAFSPQALVKTVHSNCLPLALQKGLALQLNIDPNLPRAAIGDRRRIEQILSNLVVNAIKYTETGSVEIHSFKDHEPQWVLRVMDTGIGISPEAQEYIFEPFRQVDETRSRRFGGVGLGLAIVQQLVYAMQGTVSLESEIGKGSIFTVVLPLRTVE